MTPFGTWLAEIGLATYDVVFASDKIDFDVIRSLSDADLRGLGLALGDHRRLLQAVAKLDERRMAETATPMVAPGPFRPPLAITAERFIQSANKREHKNERNRPTSTPPSWPAISRAIFR
jgi:hypothetical protein